MKRNILNTLEKEMPKLTAAQRQVADYILKNPIDALFLTLDQLASVVGTSTTTVMRFSFNLGYTGYAEFQKDLQELLRNRVDPGTRIEANLKDLGRESLLIKCAEKQIENIQATIDYLSEDVTNQCVKMILQAKKIYMVGVRTSFTATYYLYEGLNRILDNCELLELDSGAQIEKILNITSSDVVIAFSFPRYARATIDAVKAIKERCGAKVITVTDGYSCPMATISDVILPCGYGSMDYHNSMSGAILVSDFLISSVIVCDYEKTKRRLEESEMLLKSLKFHI